MNAPLSGNPPVSARRPAPDEPLEQAPRPSICWGAVLAGAAGAASLSLLLLMLGVGLGLSSVSPWASEGMSAPAFGVSTILWLTFTQLAASALGGYLAGRLRSRWAGVQVDEVYFRDTAHGFLAWSVAALVTAGLLGSAVGGIVGTGAKAGAALAGTAAMAAAPAAAKAASAASGDGYFVDAMFRRDPGANAIGASNPPMTSASGVAAAGSGTRGDAARTPVPVAPMAEEALKIFANAATSGTLPKEDARYVGSLVAQQTGLAQADAERRVTDAFSRMQAKADAAKQEANATADAARKGAAKAALWGFVALLIGAFIASLSATLGGRHRDQF